MATKPAQLILLTATLAMCASPARSEQTQYVFDEACVAKKVNACVTKATKLYHEVGVEGAVDNNNRLSTTKVCFGAGTFDGELSAIQGAENTIKLRIAESIRSEVDNRYSPGTGNGDEYCPVNASVVIKSTDTNNYGCKRFNQQFRSCDIGEQGKPRTHRYFPEISEICEAAVRQIPFSNTGHSCIRELKIPDAVLEQNFIDAINAFGVVVTGLGEQIAGKDAPNELSCPHGKKVSLVYAADSQQSGLESFRKWFSKQDHGTKPTLHYKTSVKYKKNPGDGDHVTVQVYRDADKELAFDWHRFLQAALATEARLYVVKDLSLSNLSEPKEDKEVEIVFPTSVDVASRPYLRSCLGNGS